MARWFILTVAVVWAMLIFATSCTVVRPNEFIAFLDRWVLTADGSAQFKVFWASCWLLIVKGWHFTEFAILQWLVSNSLEIVWRKRSQSIVLLAAAVCICFAASDEWHQTFVPDRFGTTWDVLVDSLGVMAVALIQVARRRLAEQTSTTEMRNRQYG